MSKKITVCHISESTTGGVHTHLRQLATYIDSVKFSQTFVLSPIKRPELKKDLNFYGSRLHLINMVRNIHPLYDLVSLIRLYKYLKKEKFDIIHCHSSKAGVIGRLAAWLTKHKNVVYTPHAFAFNSFQARWKNAIFITIEKLMAYLTSRIICVSEGEYNQAIEAKITTPDKLVVIFNGVEKYVSDSKTDRVQWLQLMGFSGEEKIIGFVGRLVLQKNPEILLRACAELSYKQFVLLIMGEGNLKKNLEALSHHLNIQDRVLFLGNVNNVMEYLKMCDIVVNTSLWEGMPYAILEAISVNVPVIATEIPGVKDVIEHLETGILVPPNDIEALKKAIMDMLLDDEKGKRLAANAKGVIESKFNVHSMVLSTQNLYGQIAQ